MSENITKIILVATDTKKKSLVFVDENLKVYSLQEAIKIAKNGFFDNVYVVNRSGNSYLRTKPSTPAKNHIDKISISSHQLFFGLDNITAALSILAFKNYWQKFIDLNAKPEIIASLYSMEKKPHDNPQPNDRGLQIVNEFYKLAKDWLE